MRRDPRRAKSAPEANLKATERRDRHRPDPTDDSSFDAITTETIVQIASILGRAHLQCAVSGLRFGLRTTKRLFQGHARLLDHLGSAESSNDFREQAVRILVDEARGCLRDVVDASSQEFRRLQSELARLQEEAREVVSGRNGSEIEYTRRWKAKP